MKSASPGRIFWTCAAVWMLVIAGLDVAEGNGVWWVLFDVVIALSCAWFAVEAKRKED